MKKFCESLREHANRIIHFKKRKMLPLTIKELKSHEDTKVCYLCEIYFIKKLFNNKNYRKVRDHCHYTGKYRVATHSICNLKFNVPNEIPVGFHNGSKYDYHFIIKELANEFEGPFECIGKNSEIYKTFSVQIKKEIKKTNKEGKESVETMSYTIKFIDSMRFKATSLSNRVDNLTKRIHKIKCKECNCFFENERVNNDFIEYKCLSCNKDYSIKINEKLKDRFKNTFKLSNDDINKFILLLRKGVYPYQYMNDWEKFNEITLPEKKKKKKKKKNSITT